MKIMAVDNEYIQLRMLERCLREAVPDEEIYPFHNSIEALDWAKQNKPEVAFCDIQMPVMDGVALGKELKRNDPKINLIYVTGYYQEYAAEAASLRYSGYLQKPITAEAVMLEMENLRYPILRPETQKLLRVQCFGNFEVYADGKSLTFGRSKTKELLAYLVDRKGAQVKGNEVCAAIFEDDSREKQNKSELRNCVADLRATLAKAGAEEVFKKGFDAYAIRPELIECDYYDWEKNEPYAVRAFRGEYMNQYSWGEMTLASLMDAK